MAGITRRGFLRTGALAAGSLTLAACGPHCGGRRDDGTVRFWYSYGGRNRQVTEQLIGRYNATHPLRPVKGTYQGDYFEALAKFRLAATSASGPDLTHVISEAVPQLWHLGLLEDLEPWAAGARGGSALDRDDLIPALAQPGTFESLGAPLPLCGLPFNRSTPIAYYNRRMLDQAGVQPPNTWAELRTAAAKLTRRSGAQTSVWGFEVPVSWWFWYALLHQAGGRLLSADGRAPAWGGAEGKQALQLLVDLAQGDRTIQRPPGRDYSAWEVANTDFLGEKVAMIWTSTAFLKYFQDNARFPFGTAFLPGHVRRAVPTGGTFFVVARRRSEQRKKGAWEFLRWMLQPEQTAYWARETGYMPVSKAALALPAMKSFYAAQPDFRTALDQLRHAVRFPFSPALLEIERKVIQPSLEGPVSGHGSVAEVLAKAAAEAQVVLSRSRPRPAPSGAPASGPTQ